MLKKAIIITASALAAFLIACGSTPPGKPITESSGNAAQPSDLGAGTPGAGCATDRLGKSFTQDGKTYVCQGPKPYAWREAPATPAASAAPATTAPSLTNAQKQAIGKAQDYLKFTAFSRKGLIKQLEYEGFATADATFAVDSLNVDWNAQAAAKGKSYLDIQHFSRKGLIDQLKFEGFTDAQAAYGAKANGL